MNTKDILFQERSASRVVNCLLLGGLLTGLTTFLITTHIVWIQWTVLAHMLIGTILSFATVAQRYQTV